MEALALIVMGRTSAPVLMVTRESTVRISCAGVTLLLVKMEARAGSRAPHTPASVRRDGPASTVTFPVCPVRSPPNSKVWRWLNCAGTRASVWMLGTRTTAAAKQVTPGVTARNKWTSAPPTPARTEPHALII